MNRIMNDNCNIKNENKLANLGSKVKILKQIKDDEKWQSQEASKSRSKIFKNSFGSN